MKFFVLFVLAFGPAAWTLADEIPESGKTAKPFVHPGLLHISWGTLMCYGLPVAADSLIAGDKPVVLGHGAGLFKVGSLLAHDDFENLNNWEVQIQHRSGFPPAKVVTRDHSLDCLLPGCGCTVWFKQKLPTRVAISYDVLCPTPKAAIKGVQPRDINNFWMASDPVDSQDGLFDSTRYTGKFSS